MIIWTRWSHARRERKSFILISLACMFIGLVAAAQVTAHVPKMIAVTVAAIGIFGALPVFWTLPTSILGRVADLAVLAFVLLLVVDTPRPSIQRRRRALEHRRDE
jgi:ACS family tartrate transporter-like MFS transporter